MIESHETVAPESIETAEGRFADLLSDGASLGDLESDSTETVSLAELKEQAARNAEELYRAGFAPSDPWARLERKRALG